MTYMRNLHFKLLKLPQLTLFQQTFHGLWGTMKSDRNTIRDSHPRNSMILGTGL